MRSSIAVILKTQENYYRWSYGHHGRAGRAVPNMVSFVSPVSCIHCNNIRFQLPNFSTLQQREHRSQHYCVFCCVVCLFVCQVFNSGSQYGTVNCYRTAISLIVVPLAQDEGLTRCFKGVYRLRPPLRRYNVTWDTSKLLDYLASLCPNESLSLEKLWNVSPYSP